MRDRAAPFAAALLLVLCLPVFHAGAFDRVPRPDFESGYQYPDVEHPVPRNTAWEYIDIAVLAAALGVSVWLTLKARSRIGVVLLSFFSIGYFGFFRKGCVCSVGSIQNIALALFSNGYAVPVTVVLLFVLPLITALFAGRAFCSSVCPLGALQDLVVIKHTRIPTWLSIPLRFFPVVYLGLAVLFAATESDFIICRFDPFISIFRLDGPIDMVFLGAVFLVTGTLIARPYCRFVCPYGVLLGWMTSLSMKRVSITPDTCIQCGLCSDACPVDAIEPPAGQEGAADAGPVDPREKRRLALFLMLVPLILAAGGLAGRFSVPVLSRMHPDIRLAEQITREDGGLTAETTLESDTFRASTTEKEDLYRRAEITARRFRTGSTLFGIFTAAGFCWVFILTFRKKRSMDWEIRAPDCVSCGRCFSYCPREHLRRSGRS